MEISKKSWIYRVAYWHLFEEHRPDDANLCRFFWRVVLSVFILSPIFLFLAAVAEIVVFLFAHRCNFDAKEGEILFKPFNHWPRIGNHKVYPITLAPLILVVLYWKEIKTLLHYPIVMTTTYPIATLMVVVVWIGMWLAWLTYGFAKRRPGIGQIIRAYIKAKKDRVCPMIKFVE